MSAAVEELPPQVPSLPSWPGTPPSVDATGTSFLVLAAGGGPDAMRIAGDWVERAQAHGVATLGVIDDVDLPADRARITTLLNQARTGVRVMLVGDQYDVLQLLALLRQRGALETEMRSFVTDTASIPVFCGHCQTVFRAEAAPGTQTDCPGCRRRLVVHEHLALMLGSFLASDTGETPP